MSCRPRRSMVGLAALLVLAALPAASQPPSPDRNRITARAFEIHYQPLVDAADVISPLLSEEGTVTLRPRLSVLVVEDRLTVLRRVADLLEDWDVPPRNVEITLSLFLGIDRHDEDPRAPRADNGLSREVRGVLEKVSNFTKWTTYEPLGSRSVTGTEGDTVVANLSDEYRVVFVVESVDETRGAVKFERLQLQRITVDDDGAESVHDLYTAALVLPAGKLKLVGAASDPNSRRALFLALQTRPR
jgi:hypothetical protein